MATSKWTQVALMFGLLFLAFETQAEECDIPDSGRAPYSEEGETFEYLKCHAQWQRLREQILYLEERGFRPSHVRRSYLEEIPQPLRGHSQSSKDSSKRSKEWKRCMKIVNSLRTSLMSACARMHKSQGKPNFSGNWEFIDRKTGRSFPLRLQRVGGGGYSVTIMSGPSGAMIGKGRATATENGLSLRMEDTKGSSIRGNFRIQDGEGQATCIHQERGRQPKKWPCELVQSP